MTSKKEFLTKEIKDEDSYVNLVFEPIINGLMKKQQVLIQFNLLIQQLN